MPKLAKHMKRAEKQHYWRVYRELGRSMYHEWQAWEVDKAKKIIARMYGPLFQRIASLRKRLTVR